MQYQLELNEQQQRAVEATDGPTLLLAVPGSGKTTVIVARVAYMIQQRNIAPKNILTLTYSRAAAKDMKMRFRSSYPSIACPEFRTIHSFCYKLLKEYYENANLNLPKSEGNPERILRKILPGYPKELFLQEIVQNIGYAKNNMITEDLLDKIKIDDVVSFKKLFHTYEHYKKDNNIMDYDDMLQNAYHLMQKNNSLLRDYQNRYSYINVDEAQDTSLLQHEIIRLLASRNQNIFMVGDEDQSIYAFRAAYPKALLQFESTYPDAKVLLMETNYRSTPQIILPANRFIKQNKNRHNKDMNTPNPNGDDIQYKTFNDISGQYEYILDMARSKPEGESLAIIYRNNVLAVPIIELFHEHNQGYSIRKDSSVLKDFFNSLVVKDIINILKLAQDPRDFKSFEKIYYKLGFYLNKEKDLLMIHNAIARDEEETVSGMIRKLANSKTGTVSAKMKSFHSILAQIAQSRPADAIGMIMDNLGYRERIKEIKSDGGESVATQLSRVNALRIIAQKIDTITSLFMHMDTMRNYQLSDDADSNITLTTIHSSKGLEFDWVIITDVISDVIPAASGGTVLNDIEQHEEEVRLFYVAMTRARKELSILSYRSIFGETVFPSIFIRQLTEALPARIKDVSRRQSTPLPEIPSYLEKPVDDIYRRGNVVEHKAFGRGTIVSVDEKIITIRFEVTIKKFDLDICKEQGLIRCVGSDSISV